MSLTNKKTTDLFDSLEKEGLSFNEQEKQNIIERINSITSYRPKIGILGKTGVGKKLTTLRF